VDVDEALILAWCGGRAARLDQLDRLHPLSATLDQPGGLEPSHPRSRRGTASCRVQGNRVSRRWRDG
jgi:hypothetical protein